VRARHLATVVLSAAAAVVLAAAPAGARAQIDPSTLSPVPPAGADCWGTGADDVVCHTFVNVDPVGEPALDLTCGTLYLTGPDHRLGTRWYSAGVLQRRLVRQDVDQTVSLQPDMSGRTLHVEQHASWWGVSDDALVFHGNTLTVSGPGVGVVAKVSGKDDLDGTHHGVIRLFDDPAVDAAMCAALT
jgi:hypothetical protein